MNSEKNKFKAYDKAMIMSYKCACIHISKEELGQGVWVTTPGYASHLAIDMR